MLVYYTSSREHGKVNVITAVKMHNHGDEVQKKFIKTSERDFDCYYQENFGHKFNRRM